MKMAVDKPLIPYTIADEPRAPVFGDKWKQRIKYVTIPVTIWLKSIVDMYVLTIVNLPFLSAHALNIMENINIGIECRDISSILLYKWEVFA